MNPTETEAPSTVSGGGWLPRPWSILLWTAIAVLLLWEVKVSVNSAWRNPQTDPLHRSDFTVPYIVGRTAMSGGNIYELNDGGEIHRPYLYPPMFAVFPMIPISLFPYNAALLIYTLINVLLLFGTLLLLKKTMWPSEPLWGGRRRVPSELTGAALWRHFLGQPNTGLLLAAIVCFRYIHSNARHNNVNMYITFLLALGMWLMSRYPEKGHEFSSGLSIALATAYKVVPGLFGLYLLWSRRIWGMLGGAIGLVIFLLLIPALPFGFSNNLKLLDEYSTHLRASMSGDSGEADLIGHEKAELKQLEGGLSLLGTLMRYMTYKPMKNTHDDGTVTYHSVNFFPLPESTARNVARFFELLLLGITIVLTARRAARLTPEGIALSFGLIATAMVVLSPLTRKANLCVLLIPCVAMLALIQQGKISGRTKKFCLIAMATVCLSGAVFSVELIGRFYGEWFSHAGLDLFYLLLFYAANAWALWKLESSRPVVPTKFTRSAAAP